MSMEIEYTELLEELLDELLSDLEEGILESDDEIQVLRHDEALEDGTFPILEIYYEDGIMQELFDVDENEEDFETIQEEKELYLQDKEHLKMYKVSDIIEEMKAKLNK